MTTPSGNPRKLENQAQHLDYYPHWLDNLAEDVVLQGAVFNGELRGAEQVGTMLFGPNLYYRGDARAHCSTSTSRAVGGRPGPAELPCRSARRSTV